MTENEGDRTKYYGSFLTTLHNDNSDNSDNNNIAAAAAILNAITAIWVKIQW